MLVTFIKFNPEWLELTEKLKSGEKGKQDLQDFFDQHGLPNIMKVVRESELEKALVRLRKIASEQDYYTWTISFEFDSEQEIENTLPLNIKYLGREFTIERDFENTGDDIIGYEFTLKWK